MNELEKKCREVFRMELKSSEEMDEIMNMASTGEINEAMSNVVEDLIKKIEDPERKLKVFILCYRFGQTLESQEMEQFGQERIEQWKAEHGSQ